MIPLYKFGGNSQVAWDDKYVAEGVPSQDPTAYLRQPFVQRMLTYLQPGMRLLDAGCGTGGLLWFLHRRGYAVTGVDASAVAIEAARRLVPDTELRVTSIEALPFPDATFDVYLAIGSWEYPPRGPEHAAAEAARVLKPGGLAFVEVPQLSTLRRLMYVPLKRLQRRLKENRELRFSHHLFSVAEMRKLLARHGFDGLETLPHDLPEATRHYGLWVDWPFLRARANPTKFRPQAGRSGVGPYELNVLGHLVKTIGNAVSPWTIATGMFIVARKK